MAFPNMTDFPESYPGPYERQMGVHIVGLLRVFGGSVPDTESNAHVFELASTPGRWSAGHAVFREVRRRFLTASETKDRASAGQYCFEESCCQALYNATDPRDPFDPSSAFFVVAQALRLANAVGIPLDVVAAVFRSAASDMGQ